MKYQDSFEKEKRKFNFIILYILGFIISVFFEFYWISYFPYDYFMLFGIGIILCIFGYLSIDGILEMLHRSQKQKEKQNEVMIKASKAIYLTTKKLLAEGDSISELSYRISSDEASAHSKEAENNFNSLVSDLVKANERLAASVEQAVAIQPLVKENKKIIDTVRSGEQSASDISEVSSVLDEALSEDTVAILSDVSENSSANKDFSSDSSDTAEEPVEKITEVTVENSGDTGLSQEEIASLFANL